MKFEFFLQFNFRESASSAISREINFANQHVSFFREDLFSRKWPKTQKFLPAKVLPVK